MIFMNASTANFHVFPSNRTDHERSSGPYLGQASSHAVRTRKQADNDSPVAVEFWLSQFLDTPRPVFVAHDRLSSKQDLSDAQKAVQLRPHAWSTYEYALLSPSTRKAYKFEAYPSCARFFVVARPGAQRYLSNDAPTGKYRDHWHSTAELQGLLLPAWRALITKATSKEEIVAVFRIFGLVEIADRLRYLFELDAEEPEEPSIELESLRNMALFLMGKRQLQNPEIAASPNGLVLCEWQLPHHGILAIEFLPSDTIRFAAVSGSTDESGQRKRVNGTLPEDDALAALRTLLPKEMS